MTSMPVRKAVAPEHAGGRIFKGTAVVNGTGRAVVTGVGAHTELGSIAELVQQAKRTATPLESKLAALARQLVLVTSGLVAVFVVISLVRGAPTEALIKTAIVLAVAAIPEGMAGVRTCLRDNDVLRDRLVWLALALCCGLLLTYFVPLLRTMLGIQALPPIALLFIVAPAVLVLVLAHLLGRPAGPGAADPSCIPPISMTAQTP